MHRRVWPIHALVALLIVVVLGAGTCAAQETPAAPKNVIIMIGDGCGFNHLAAASMYLTGKPGSLPFEQFPVRLAASTFSNGGSYDPARAWVDMEYVKQKPTDSAAAATALSTGVKTNNGMLGVDPDQAPVKHTLEYAEALGKATGVVTSVPLSHATPAGFSAHQAARSEYAGIAREMIERSGLDVLMGCGHPTYDEGGRALTVAPTDLEKQAGYVGGAVLWGALNAETAGADADGDGTPDPWTLIEAPEQFDALISGDTPKRVIGVTRAHSVLQQGRPATVDCNGDGELDAADIKVAEPYQMAPNAAVPSLATMVRGALNVLDSDPDGLALMVEGGAIDWAAHSNQLGRVVEEVIDFSKAVEAVVAWVEADSNWNETVLIVTADHETGLLTGPDSAEAPLPLRAQGAGRLPLAEFHSGEHTNSLVPVFAIGWGVDKLAARATGTDPVRGAYLDNTDIAKFAIEALGGPK